MENKKIMPDVTTRLNKEEREEMMDCLYALMDNQLEISEGISMIA